jgi:hypothetical protein
MTNDNMLGANIGDTQSQLDDDGMSWKPNIPLMNKSFCNLCQNITYDSKCIQTFKM